MKKLARLVTLAALICSPLAIAGQAPDMAMNSHNIPTLAQATQAGRNCLPFNTPCPKNPAECCDHGCYLALNLKYYCGESPHPPMN